MTWCDALMTRQFERPLDRQIYGVGITQILTKNLISSLNFETVTDEGFLNNPYRSVRYFDAGSATWLQLRAGAVSQYAHQ